MPFTAVEFGPGRTFNTLEEYNEALTLMKRLKKSKEPKRNELPEEKFDIDGEFEIVKIRAEIKGSNERADLMEKRIDDLNAKFSNLVEIVKKMSDIVELINSKKTTLNKDGIPIDIVLHGSSLGKTYQAKVLNHGYIIDDNLYSTLSAAALAVSGNRRSGWQFWKKDGKPVGEIYKCKHTETGA